MKKDECSDVQIISLLESNYTRQEDIERGFLVDISEKANEACLDGSVAMTATVYEKFANAPGEVQGSDKEQQCDEIDFILWTLGHLLAKRPPRRMKFQFRVIGLETGDVRFELKAIREVGDEGEPCLTIVGPDEEY